MAESLFDIFGGHRNRQIVKNVTRQPLSNIENMGKTVSAGPIKPNEPMKKAGEPKKSFMSNAGKALQSTPVRKVFTPQSVNVSALIYSDDNNFKMEEIEFTKPAGKKKFDNYKELFEYLLPEPELGRQDLSPPSTPPPKIRQHSFELDSSHHDEFFADDDFSFGSLPDDDELGLPALY